MSTVRIPAPLPHQVPIIASSARRKVLRGGRRGRKSRIALHAAIVGHGPQGDHELTVGEGEYQETHRWTGPMHRAVAQGWHVYWIARDMPQFKILWSEDIAPRFKNVPGIRCVENDHRVEFPGGGALWARTAENIASVRGSGSKLAGVIIDEAAWMDLEATLRNVVLPALVDNKGWLMLLSTTNAGVDGNKAGRIPSYFNMICEQIHASERGAEWAEFHFTAFDNPKLSHSAIEELIAEYPAEAISLAQEVYAKLIKGGAGLALGELNEQKHLIAPFKVPEHWPRFGGFDWGHAHPWSFGSYAVDEQGQVFKLDTITGRKQRPDEIAAKIWEVFPDVDTWDYLIAGSDIKALHGGRLPSTMDVPTIAEQLADEGLDFIYGRDGANTLLPRLNNFRHYVAWTGTGPKDEFGLPTNGTPRFRWFRTPGNEACFKQCSVIVTDPKRPEIPLRRDADPQSGEGGDDQFAETMLALSSRPFAAEALELDVNEDVHPGFEGKVGQRKRKSRYATVPDDDELEIGFEFDDPWAEE
jgi:hypothetical protein